jgi:hypothetical protein|tara:strand:- start:25033 stop:25173 length:141 start_codon:yes stop_codon:yes gene_type:complete
MQDETIRRKQSGIRNFILGFCSKIIRICQVSLLEEGLREVIYGYFR